MVNCASLAALGMKFSESVPEACQSSRQPPWRLTSQWVSQMSCPVWDAGMGVSNGRLLVFQVLPGSSLRASTLSCGKHAFIQSVNAVGRLVLGDCAQLTRVVPKIPRHRDVFLFLH